METFFNNLVNAEMHAGDLIQLSCLLAIYPPEINHSKYDCLDEHIKNYWTASRDRIDRWQFHLPRTNLVKKNFKRKLAKRSHDFQSDNCLELNSVRALVIEMILSEPLSRVWAAILAKSELGNMQSIPLNIPNPYRNLAYHILEKHSDLLGKTIGNLENSISDLKIRESLKKLVRRTHRWTDLLLAHIEQTHPVSHFAPNPERCLEFAGDLRKQLSQGIGRQTAALTIASARRSICKQMASMPFSAGLNYRIGASVLQSCAPKDLNSLGLLNSLGMVRLLETFSQCEELLTEILDTPSTALVASVG